MKNTIYIIVIALIACATSNTASAQQIPLFSSYNLNKVLLNPSYAGMDNRTNLFGLSRIQFAGFDNGPVTNMFTGDAGFEDKNMGLGAMLYSDKTNIINQVGIHAMYAYRVKLSKTTTLGLGFSAGVDQWALNFDQINVQDASEDLIVNSVSTASTFRGDFGVSIKSDRFLVGLAVPKLFTSGVSYTNDLTNVEVDISQIRHLVANLGYTLPIKEGVMEFNPMIVMRAATDVTPQFDANFGLNFVDKGYVSVGYRSNYAVTLGGGLILNNNFIVGYNYDKPVNEISKFTSGSHEFVLGVRLNNGKSNSKNTLSAKDKAELQNLVKVESDQRTLTDNKVKELEDKVEEYDNVIRKQDEELDRLNKLLNQSSIELEKLKTDQQAILDAALRNERSSGKNLSDEDKKEKVVNIEEALPETTASYLVVIASVKDVNKARGLQKSIERNYGLSSNLVKRGSWYFLYESSHTTGAEAVQRRGEVTKVLRPSHSRYLPWIYMQK